MSTTSPQHLVISLLDETLAICRADPAAPIPLWATAGAFWTISRTSDELSIVCSQEHVPADIQSIGDWRCFKVEGPLDFALTGILAALATALANAGISIFALSTYDTDYLLVKQEQVERAADALRSLGHHVRPLT